MKAQDTVRKARAKAALQPLGIDPTVTRVSEAQMSAGENLAALLRLPPEDGAATEESSQQDPETGGLFFMVGLSPIGGSNPIA